MQTPLAPPRPPPRRFVDAQRRERYALAVLAGFATATRVAVIEMDPQTNAKVAVAWADALIAALDQRYSEDAQ